MPTKNGPTDHDFKGIGFSKIGYFKEVRSKIKELETVNIELVRRHNKLEAIINSISDGLTILDRDLNVIFTNKVQTQMFPEVSLAGKHCHEAFFRRPKRCRNCPALRAMETKETYRGEVLIKEGGFAGRYYEWTVSPIIGPFGKVSEIVLIMRDVTPRKDYEHKLLQADRMAAIGLLSASIAHEINNPLTSIAGFSEGLLKRLKSKTDSSGTDRLDSFREYLEIIFNEAYRAKDIIQRLHEYSQPATEGAEVLDVDRIVRNTVSLLRQHAKDRRIKMMVKNNLNAGMGLLAGNESQLKHLFLNVFYLALQAVRGGGEITTVERNSGTQIEIVIKIVGNDGLGDISDKLPIPYCSAFSESGEQLSPINLSVCYGIMRNHDGNLSFDMAEDAAACTLVFPAVMPSESPDTT